jgi:hypothetical protein
LVAELLQGGRVLAKLGCETGQLVDDRVGVGQVPGPHRRGVDHVNESSNLSYAKGKVRT